MHWCAEQWADALHRWLGFTESDFHIVYDKKDANFVRKNVKFLIISYDWVPKLKMELERKAFQVPAGCCSNMHPPDGLEKVIFVSLASPNTLAIPFLSRAHGHADHCVRREPLHQEPQGCSDERYGAIAQESQALHTLQRHSRDEPPHRDTAADACVAACRKGLCGQVCGQVLQGVAMEQALRCGEAFSWAGLGLMLRWRDGYVKWQAALQVPATSTSFTPSAR